MLDPTQTTREGLSALMDGEASSFEIKRLPVRAGEDVALRASWQRYQLVSAVLHQQPLGSGLGDVAFADRIQQRLAQQGVSAELPRVRAARRWPRWAGQLTVAASCAAVAVGVATWQMQHSTTEVQVAAAVDSARRATVPAPAIVSVQPPQLIEAPLLSPINEDRARLRQQWQGAHREMSPVNYRLPHRLESP